MSDSSSTYSTVLSGIVGLIVGALVIYFGIENLTEKMMTANENLGVLKATMNASQASADEARERAESTLYRLKDLEKHADTINDKLKKIENTTTSEIADQLDVISSFSGGQEALIELTTKTRELQSTMDGQLVYSCPSIMPSGCDAAQHCQSMCGGQLQISKKTCTHRLPGGKASEKNCSLVGRLVKP